MSIFKRNRKASDSNWQTASWSRRGGSLDAVPESSSPTITGPTFGPWATHNPRCTCNVCR